MKYSIRICILTLILFLVISNLKSQSLEFVTKPETHINGHPDSAEIKSYAVVRNKSLNSVNIKVKMTIVELCEGHMLYFCLGNCFPPRTTDFEMPDNTAITLAPGEATEGPKFFDVVLIPGGLDCCTSVKMTFMVVGNPSDMVEYTVTFCSTTPVIETEKEAFIFAEPVPNPAEDYIRFSYELPEGNTNGLLEIYDNLGLLIDKLKLDEQNIVKYNTALLPSGKYYAVMNIQDKRKAVRKFVVSH